MVAFTRRHSTLAVAAACVLILAQAAQARGTFDGAWSVDISGRSGNCDGMTYQYDLQIINNQLHYGGADARISGSVSPSGEVNVRLSNGASSATGAGHLTGRTGRGRFYGRSSSGVCSGNWSAVRTGG